MANGITTIISRIGIPEKIAEVNERIAENRQATMVSYSQQQAEERVKTVQQPGKAEQVTAIRREKKEQEQEREKKKKQNKEQKKQATGNTGTNIDFEA